MDHCLVNAKLKLVAKNRKRCGGIQVLRRLNVQKLKNEQTEKESDGQMEKVEGGRLECS